MGYDDELDVLRGQINGIDKQLLALFEDRMDAVKRVASLKEFYGKAVYDAKREDEVIKRALWLLRNKEYSEEAKAFFQALMDTSKKSEHKKIGKKAVQYDIGAKSTGYLGIRGSFSHIAAEDVFPDSDLVNYNTFESIFEALKAGEIDHAILPAENTETGSITAVVDLLAKYGFYIVGEKMLYVSESLLGTEDAKFEDIKAICSHPEPFAQCSQFLAQYPMIEKRSALSTAQAARAVAQAGDKSVACIASAKAAPVYSLKVLRENIQNSDSNYTRFIIVAKHPCLPEGCDKTSVAFAAEHHPGSLSEILNVFSQGNINILKLESRPIKNKPFEYLFHLDFEGGIGDENVRATIDKVRDNALGFIFLGSYKKDVIQ